MLERIVKVLDAIGACDTIKSVFIFIVGCIADRIFGKWLDDLKKAHKSKKVRKKIGQMRDRRKVENIDWLAYGYPYFSMFDMDISETNFDVKLALPEGFADKMPCSAGSFSPKDTNGIKLILDILSKVGVSIDDINEVRKEIACKFCKKESGLNFNGAKYGISYFDGFSRSCDVEERPILTMRVFETDYYTHHVITSTMMKKNVKIVPGSLKESDTLLNTFCTAFGLSIIVILPEENEIVLTKRAQSTAYNDGKTWTYISVTEAFTGTDQGFDAKPSLEACLRRGLSEELGIPDNKIIQDSIKFYDVFFENHFLQMGLVASVELKPTVDFSDIKTWYGKDTDLEIDGLFTVKNTAQKIEQYIDLHRSEMRPQTICALESYMSRL